MIDERINFRHLRCFVEVARLNSVSEAAGRMNLAQSAVSRTIADLERIVGIRLLDRSRRGSFLTEEGRVFHDLVAPSLAHIRSAFSVVDPRVHATEVLAIATLPTVSVRMLPDVLMRFQRLHPDTTVRVLEGRNVDLLDRLRRGEIALVLGRLAGADAMQGLAFEQLYKEQIICVVSPGHPLDVARTHPAPDILAHPIIAHPPGTIVRDELDRKLLSAGLGNLKGLVETNSMSLARSLALCAEHVWIVPEGMVEPDLRAGTLQRLNVTDWDLLGAVGVSTNPKAPPGSSAQALLHEIRIAAANFA